MQVGRRVLRTALIAGSALGLTAGGSVFALASGPAAQASTACAAAWSSTAVYTAGQQASENGINYTANWWTQGNDPATNNGGSGSGEPWTSDGSCTGGSGGGGGGGGGGRRWRRRHGLGERPALQPVQGRHHQHELEHLPDAVGRGRLRPAGGRRQQPGVELHPEAARDHPRVRYRSLRQRDLGRRLGRPMGGREHPATPQRQPRLRCLDRRPGRDVHLRLDGWHGSVHRSLRQPQPGRHRLRHRRRPVRGRTSRTWSTRRPEHRRSTRTCSSRSRSPRWPHPMAATAE